MTTDRETLLAVAEVVHAAEHTGNPTPPPLADCPDHPEAEDFIAAAEKVIPAVAALGGVAAEAAPGAEPPTTSAGVRIGSKLIEAKPLGSALAVAVLGALVTLAEQLQPVLPLIPDVPSWVVPVLGVLAAVLGGFLAPHTARPDLAVPAVVDEAQRASQLGFAELAEREAARQWDAQKRREP